ncbi:MAG: M48 family metallopeptidase [Pirellulaceae bacterium]
MSYYRRNYQSGRNMSALKVRLLIAAAIILFSVVSYWANTDINPINGKPQRVGGLSTQDEIVLGLQSVPEMANQFGGFSRDAVATQQVVDMGERLVNALASRLNELNRKQPYEFNFYLLDDDRTVNAFALPGGQIFITEALYHELNHQGQLAAVLGHEIGHVLERHSAQQMAKQKMFVQWNNAAWVASGDIAGERISQIVTGLIGMKYGRSHELESDRWGIELMVMINYHPDHMLEVMDILAKTSGGGAQPEFMSTHPSPPNRKEHINLVIGEVFPYGIPDNLQ